MSEQPHGTSPAEITASVVERFDACPDARLREIMQSLARHLHAFAAEVGLTEEEWHVAIRMLTETGQITDERRQEFILWSDTMGLSMLVDAMAHELPAGATESTVLGPFYVPGSPLREHGANIAEQEAGLPAWVHGRVLSTRRLADRGRRARHLAERRQPPVRGAGPGGSGAPPARPLHDPRRRLVRLPRRAPGALSDPRRRTGGRDAGRDRAPPLAPGAHPCDRPRARASRR